MSVHPDTKWKREFKFQPDQKKKKDFSRSVVVLHNLDMLVLFQLVNLSYNYIAA